MSRTWIAAALLGALGLFGCAEPYGAIDGGLPTERERLTASSRCASEGESAQCLEAYAARFAPLLPPATDYAAAGPYPVTSDPGGRGCTIFRPESLGEGGLRHPVILWGNGTGTTPVRYAGLLRHWASHGFVVAAADTTNAGRGAEMLACLDWLTEQNAASEGVYAHKLNIARVGTAGHSQGGGGAIMAGRDPRIDATVPFEPYILGLGHEAGASALQHAPMLLLSGGADTIARPDRNQAPVFQQASAPVFWATLNGAGHMVPMNDAGGFRGPSTAWFRHYLAGDAAAGALFKGGACGLCASAEWKAERKGIS